MHCWAASKGGGLNDSALKSILHMVAVPATQMLWHVHYHSPFPHHANATRLGKNPERAAASDFAANARLTAVKLDADVGAVHAGDFGGHDGPGGNIGRPLRAFLPLTAAVGLLLGCARIQPHRHVQDQPAACCTTRSKVQAMLQESHKASWRLRNHHLLILKLRQQSTAIYCVVSSLVRVWALCVPKALSHRAALRCKRTYHPVEKQHHWALGPMINACGHEHVRLIYTGI